SRGRGTVWLTARTCGQDTTTPPPRRALLLNKRRRARAIPRRFTPRDDESVSNRYDASRLALGRISSLPHSALCRCQRFGKRGSREQSLGVFHQRCRLLRHLNGVVIEAPEQRRDRDVEHRVILTEHVLVLGEHRRDLHQRIAHE